MSATGPAVRDHFVLGGRSRSAPRLSKCGVVAEFVEQVRPRDGLFASAPQMPPMRTSGSWRDPSLPGQFEHRPEQTDLRIADGKLCGVNADGESADSGGDVVARAAPADDARRALRLAFSASGQAGMTRPRCRAVRTFTGVLTPAATVVRSGRRESSETVAPSKAAIAGFEVGGFTERGSAALDPIGGPFDEVGFADEGRTEGEDGAGGVAQQRVGGLGAFDVRVCRRVRRSASRPRAR
jgi:hypothetical protein